MKISGYLDDEGAALLETLDCDNLEYGFIKRYIGINFSDWPDA